MNRFIAALGANADPERAEIAETKAWLARKS